jgi:prepilin-type N-terminal cleavage/methylation domain-containing protein
MTVREDGFTLIELMTALTIFLLICGAAFSLLGASQQRFKTESQLSSSFQDARLAVDQIVRDANDAGYPPPSYVNTVAPGANPTVTPFAWSPGYSTLTGCSLGTGGGGTCATPGDWDLIVETNPNPQDAGSQVEWIRYQLQGTTLFRGVAPMIPAGDPVATTAAQMVPFVQNVVNNSSASQIAQFQINYPSMFPGGNPVPIFSFTCDTPTGPVACTTAGASNSPSNIRDVLVTLIVATSAPDGSTGVPRIVQLSGRGRRMNPNQ